MVQESRISALSCALVLVLTSASEAADPIRRYPPPPVLEQKVPIVLCKRTEPVGYWDLPGVLNRVYSCRGVAYCKGGLVAWETKTIADYGEIAQWLWGGSSDATFSIAQQDAIIANAVQLANANKPTGKVVARMTFFPDFLVGSSGYFIGAHVRYAKCGVDLPR